ncbi:hypothetical protein HUK80_02595 [Flavobacterium sp. MAH-1]|uniref:Uncharacterized protein n=1 Tax=Flavobacterium agri TaxID=2743471 RepID=A0A7Y8XZH8_9FLAO|nr:hypothetical protein [Flavobacterium agri]NUY79769.1 hypothetical protein [Flavobacterium agri]NYA69794.1 hypothetical protein [Flavobacterium agri]
MKPFQNLLIALLLILSANVFGQEQNDVKRLPFDAETNCQIRYYYYPNLEAYFDNLNSIYIFKDKGIWVKEKEIPSGYRGYGLFNKAHIAINDYDDEDPTQFLEAHRKKYPYNSLKRQRNATASVE